MQDHKLRFSEALLRVAGDVDLLVAMAMFVVDDAPDVFSELKLQIDGNLFSDAAATAHKLKGLLSTFETGGPVLELHELMVAAKAGNAEDCRQALRKCDAGIEQLIGEIAQLQSHQV